MLRQCLISLDLDAYPSSEDEAVEILLQQDFVVKSVKSEMSEMALRNALRQWRPSQCLTDYYFKELEYLMNKPVRVHIQETGEDGVVEVSGIISS